MFSITSFPSEKYKHLVDTSEVEDRKFEEYFNFKTQHAFAAPSQIYDEAADRPEQ